MTIVRNQQSLYNLISSKLNENSYGVEFRSDLFNSQYVDYYYKDDNGRKVRYVPTMLPDVVGEYLNVPNANTTINSVALQFDVFVGYEGNSDKEAIEYASVGYTETLNAIEEFKASLLAKYFPLGTSYLYMGGEDSTVEIDLPSRKVQAMYFKLIPYNTDEETILEYQSVSPQTDVIKTADKIRFEYTSGSYLEIDYTVGEEVEFVVYHDGTDWHMDVNGGTNATPVTASNGSIPTTQMKLGGDAGSGDTGFEGLVKRFAFSTDAITDFDFDDLEIELQNWQIDLSTWDSKDAITNSGDLTGVSGTINNCILWSEDGNAVFSFGTLNPISQMRAVDGGVWYQLFELEIECVISNDVVFGNNFEYQLSTDDGTTYEQIYPIDRSHTLGTELNMAQKINDNYGTGIVEESSRDHTLSFYYIPSKKLNKLLKHVVTGDTGQNTTYKLKVQYPFFQHTYDVVLDTGGIEPNINTIATFTVTFKRSDSSL